MICYGLLFVMWCAQDPLPVTDSYCVTYKPVMWSSGDTRGTKEQVDVNNRVWKKLCGGQHGSGSHIPK